MLRENRRTTDDWLRHLEREGNATTRTLEEQTLYELLHLCELLRGIRDLARTTALATQASDARQSRWEAACATAEAIGFPLDARQHTLGGAARGNDHH
ncbi:MAG: hypothetical protein U0821_18645 [Chloroflexota bacterium]